MDTREGSGGRTFRHVVGEQLALGGQRRNLLRVALQRMVIDGAAVAARQDRSNGAEREGPLHSFLTMLIAPPVSSTAHFTSSDGSIEESSRRPTTRIRKRMKRYATAARMTMSITERS